VLGFEIDDGHEWLIFSIYRLH